MLARVTFSRQFFLIHPLRDALLVVRARRALQRCQAISLRALFEERVGKSKAANLTPARDSLELSWSCLVVLLDLVALLLLLQLALPLLLLEARLPEDGARLSSSEVVLVDAGHWAPVQHPGLFGPGDCPARRPHRVV